MEDHADDRVQPNGDHVPMWKCRCICGNYTIASGGNLKSGHTTRCIECARRAMSMSKRKLNTYDLSQDVGIGYTTNTNKMFLFDKTDYDSIKNYCWAEHYMHDGRSYVGTSIESKTIRLHSFLTGWALVDHVDRDRFNNQRSNLRQCTIADNCRNRSVQKNNTSGYVGVTWDKSCGMWSAQIECDGKHHNLGLFSDKNDAIKARLLAEKEMFGEYAPQQYLYKQYEIT